MKISITMAVSFVVITFCVVLFVNVMNFNVAMQKVNDYHYATVHEIESSDFAEVIMNARENDKRYDTSIIEKSIKEDMQIYEVRTSKVLSIPILGFSKEYVKVSMAR